MNRNRNIRRSLPAHHEIALSVLKSALKAWKRTLSPPINAELRKPLRELPLHQPLAEYLEAAGYPTGRALREADVEELIATIKEEILRGAIDSGHVLLFGRKLQAYLDIVSKQS